MRSSSRGNASDDNGVYDETGVPKRTGRQWLGNVPDDDAPSRADSGETAPDFETPYRPTTRPETAFSYDQMLAM